jgi:hypothetical protein
MPQDDQRQLDGYRIRNLTLLIDSIEEEAPEKIVRQATSGTAGLITNRRPAIETVAGAASPVTLRDATTVAACPTSATRSWF